MAITCFAFVLLVYVSKGIYLTVVCVVEKNMEEWKPPQVSVWLGVPSMPLGKQSQLPPSECFTPWWVA